MCLISHIVLRGCLVCVGLRCRHGYRRLDGVEFLSSSIDNSFCSCVQLSDLQLNARKLGGCLIGNSVAASGELVANAVNGGLVHDLHQFLSISATRCSNTGVASITRCTSRSVTAMKETEDSSGATLRYHARMTIFLKAQKATSAHTVNVCLLPDRPLPHYLYRTT